MKTKVSIVKGPSNPQESEIREMVENAMNLVGGIDDIISKGDRVLIKPNICYVLKPGETEVSDPRIAKAIYDILTERGANPVIGESSGSGSGTEDQGDAAFRSTGYYELRDRGYEVVNLKKTRSITLDNPNAKVLKRAKVWKLAAEVDAIINLPVIKTHDHLPATLGLKNLKGLMPDSEKKKFHRKYGLFQAIADLNLLVRPKLTIVDGIFCREGLGYPWSQEIEMDLILAGRDPVAVDTVTLLVMGIDPASQPDAVLAQQHGIGTMDLDEIDVVGESIAHVRKKFKRPAEAFQEMLGDTDIKIVSNESTCTGCKGMMHFFLKWLHVTNEIDKIKDFTFVLGEHDDLPNVHREKMILVGACNEKHKGLGRYVPGCPPLSVAVREDLFGGKSKAASSSE